VNVILNNLYTLSVRL